jgi:hypothetical protein
MPLSDVKWLSASNKLKQRRIGHPRNQPRKGILKIPGLMHLLPHPRLLQILLILPDRNGPIRQPGRQRLINTLPSLNPRLYSIVGSLNLQNIQEPSTTADQNPAREDELWDGEVAALVEGTCAVGDAFTALDLGADGGMGF